MLAQQLNEVLVSENEDDVPLSRLKDSNTSDKKTEMKRIKQKREESENVQVKKKAKFEWRPEDCAKSVGKLIKLTGEGEKMKRHYEKFEFRGVHYRLEETVLLVPEYLNIKTYIAIIKDIYVQEKDGLVKLEVQWLYRQEDIEKIYVGKWKPEDSSEVFFSFHRDDEVFAESVKYKCLVYFVPDDKQITSRTKNADFIVRMVYDNIKQKLRKFSDKCFDVEQKFEIDVLVAKTISRIGDLPDIEKVQMMTTKTPRRTRSCRKMLESVPSSELDRDKRMEELVEAFLEHMCCANKGKQAAGDYECVWPNDVVLVVFALAEALYKFFGDDIPKYNYKLELLVEKIKNTRVLARRLLNGELKPEQVIKMKEFELIMADFEEPKLVGDVGSSSKSVGRKDSLED